MKKIGLMLSLVAALALPATASAHKPDGKGKRHAKGCLVHVSSKGKHKGKRESCELKRKAKRAAVGQCRDERANDVVAFEQKYGSEGGMRNCVRQTVPLVIGEFKNAAKECKAEAEADLGKFRDKYGTNHNKRNAFGKCVSSHVREGENGGRGDEAGDDQGGNEGDSEGEQNQSGQEDAPGQDDELPDDGGGDA